MSPEGRGSIAAAQRVHWARQHAEVGTAKADKRSTALANARLNWHRSNEDAGEGGELHREKRPQYRGVCDLRSAAARLDLLSTVPGHEVWGIGGASAGKLAKLGIQTAADLAALEPDVRALMTVTGGRRVYELRGVSRLALDLMETTRTGIAVTRSFGAPVSLWTEMREAIASYATRAAEKVRRYKVAADNLFVFIHTSTFNKDPFYSNGASARFAATTNDTGEVLRLAVRLGERLLREGFRYSKCGVIISELPPEAVRQPALWGELDRERRERAWKTVDQLNATLGRGTVRILSASAKEAAWSCGRNIARRAGRCGGMNCLKREQVDGTCAVKSVYAEAHVIAYTTRTR